MKYIKAYENTINDDLFRAIEEEDVELAKDLIKKAIKLKVDLNIRDNADHTALMYAASYKENEIMKELIKAGVDLNIQDSIGWTALITAANYNNWKGVKELIKAGADLNIQYLHFADTAPIFYLKGYADGEYTQGFDVFDYIPKKKKEEIIKEFPEEYELYLLKLISNKYNL